MAFDKSGKYHMNPQRAMHADRTMKGSNRTNEHKQSGEKAEGVGDPAAGGTSKGDQAGDSTHTIIHHNEDGTHTVEHHDGETTGPHASIHEAMMHVKAKHGEPDEDDMAMEEAHEPMGMSGY